MLLTAIAIVTGLGIGVARGGSFRNVENLRVQWWPLLLGGLAIQAIAETFAVPGALSLSVIGLFAMLVALVKNTPAAGGRVAGAGVIATGVLANLTVTVLNGHVPVRFEALVEAGLVGQGQVGQGQVGQGQSVSFDDLREIETASTRLGALGDVIPLPVLDNVVSFGDLITHAGLIVLIQGAMLATRRRRGLTVDELLALAVDDAIDLTDDGPTVRTDLDLTEVLDLAEPVPDSEHSPNAEPDVGGSAAQGVEPSNGVGRIRPLSR